MPLREVKRQEIELLNKQIDELCLMVSELDGANGSEVSDEEYAKVMRKIDTLVRQIGELQMRRNENLRYIASRSNPDA